MLRPTELPSAGANVPTLLDRRMLEPSKYRWSHQLTLFSLQKRCLISPNAKLDSK